MRFLFLCHLQSEVCLFKNVLHLFVDIISMVPFISDHILGNFVVGIDCVVQLPAQYFFDRWSCCFSDGDGQIADSRFCCHQKIRCNYKIIHIGIDLNLLADVPCNKKRTPSRSSCHQIQAVNRVLPASNSSYNCKSRK